MNVTYPKIYRQAMLAVWLLMALIIQRYPTIAQVREDHKSQGVLTDSSGYDVGGENKKERRQQYYERMHRTAPDVDWKQMDQNARIDKAKARFQRARMLRLAEDEFEVIGNTEVFADGKVQGIWHETGSNNLSGRIHLAEYDAENDQVYLGSSTGNIWKSRSGGSNWEVHNDLMRIKSLIQIRRIPHANQHRIITASYEAKFGVVYSDDDGHTWEFAKGLENVKRWGHLDKMVIANDPGHTIYVLLYERDFGNGETVNSVYASYDHGENFIKLQSFRSSTFGDAGRFDIWTDYYGSGKVFLLENNYIRRLNSNNKFNIIGTIPLVDDGTNLKLTGRETNAGTYLYALYPDRNAYTSDIYQSTNGGKNWVFKGTVNQRPFHENSFECSRVNPEHVFIGGVECFRSYNGGTTWELVNGWGYYYGNPNNNLHADICGINPFVTKDGEEFILISTDGGTFISRDEMQTVHNISLSGLNVSQYYSVYTSRNNTNVIYAGSQDQGLQRSTFGYEREARDFNQMISGDYGHIVSGDRGKSIWANYPGFSIYYPNAEKSTSFKMWHFSDNGYHNFVWMRPLMPDPVSPEKVFLAGGSISGTGGSHIIHLDASGGSIQAEELPYNFKAAAGRNISALAYSPIDPDYRYVMTENGRFFLSTDGGNTWKMTQGFDGPDHFWLYGSSILPSRSQLGRVYVGGSGYSNPAVFVSEDHGKTFVPMSNNLPNTLVLQLDATPDESLVFAATELGPYVYVREDERWYDMSGTSAPDQTYWTVDYVAELNIARFGTHGRGIFDFDISVFPETEFEVLYRINTGGSSIPGDPDWTADNTKSSPYRNGGTRGSTKSVTVSLNESVPVGVSTDLFKTERFWEEGKEEMVWTFPVEKFEEVDVRIYLAETYFHAGGKRVFDIKINDEKVEEDLDLYEKLGFGVGAMYSYKVVSNGELYISFGREVENPSIKGIEIVSRKDEQNTPPTVRQPLSDLSVSKNSNPIEINLSEVFSDAEEPSTVLAFSSQNSAPAVVNTSISGAILTLTFVNNATGIAEITVQATDSKGEFAEDAFTVNVTNPGTEFEVLYRINAGGSSIPGAPDWTADNTKSSPYRNGGTRGSTKSVTVNLDESVPIGVSTDLFKTERFWEEGKEEMVWTFPVEKFEEVDVRIYLAETYFHAGGKRVFDIKINDEKVEEDLDLYSLLGFGVGTMRSYKIVSDGMVDISFGREVENPSIKGIEIMGKEGVQNTSPIAEKVPNQNLPNKSEHGSAPATEASDQLSIYPNPAMGKVNIVLRGDEVNHTVIEILDVLGHPLYRFDGKGNVEEEVNVSRFHKGIYIVRGITQGKIINKRLIIE